VAEFEEQWNQPGELKQPVRSPKVPIVAYAPSLKPKNGKRGDGAPSDDEQHSHVASDNSSASALTSTSAPHAITTVSPAGFSTMSCGVALSSAISTPRLLFSSSLLNSLNAAPTSSLLVKAPRAGKSAQVTSSSGSTTAAGKPKPKAKPKAKQQRQQPEVLEIGSDSDYTPAFSQPTQPAPSPRSSSSPKRQRKPKFKPESEWYT
jgi:hypothetical protein